MMIPFSLQCIKCGEYMARTAGKKFNSRKEDVIGPDHSKIQKVPVLHQVLRLQQRDRLQDGPEEPGLCVRERLRSASFIFSPVLVSTRGVAVAGAPRWPRIAAMAAAALCLDVLSIIATASASTRTQQPRRSGLAATPARSSRAGSDGSTRRGAAVPPPARRGVRRWRGPPIRHRRDPPPTRSSRHAQLRVLAPAGRGRGPTFEGGAGEAAGPPR